MDASSTLWKGTGPALLSSIESYILLLGASIYFDLLSTSILPSNLSEKENHQKSISLHKVVALAALSPVRPGVGEALPILVKSN